MDHILIFKNDLAKYPPLITIIEILLKHKFKVTYIGFCGDNELTQNLIDKGLVYFQAIKDEVESCTLVKFVRFLKYRSRVYNLLSKISNTKSQIWIFGVQNIWVLHKAIFKYNSILYLFELPDFKIPINYRFFCSNSTYRHCLSYEHTKVVCCEYNRAHITKSYFSIPKLPYIIPNKPIVANNNISSNINLANLRGKKIILYQGIFNYPERRLEELCQSINLLPQEFILVLMGGPENAYKKMLQNKYESPRVMFLPFVAPPIHLTITKLAYIGVLSYFPSSTDLQSTLNVLYCAPNKLYEYSSFGIPMIANDLPALSQTFRQYNAGLCTMQFTPDHLAALIKEIDNNYENYSQGALSLFNAVDIEALIVNLINDRL